MATIEDDRTDEQRESHTMMVLGTDKFMSGWGEARGGASYAAWACRPDDAHRVLCWVESRKDMKRVRMVGPGYRPPRNCKHLHIYVVDDQHPALS